MTDHHKEAVKKEPGPLTEREAIALCWAYGINPYDPPFDYEAYLRYWHEEHQVEVAR